MKSNTHKSALCATMATLQRVIGGKWKIVILWILASETHRFGQLQRKLGNITQSMLTKQLRELEKDGFILRQVYQEVPPKVEYSLSEFGKSFSPILEQMYLWGQTNLKNQTETDAPEDALDS